jgi:hypothetical protein
VFSRSDGGYVEIRSAGQCLASQAEVVLAACDGSGGQRWRLDRVPRVAAWGAAMTPGTTDPGNPRYHDFTDRTVRMQLTPTTSGSQVRIRLSNRFGAEPVTIGQAYVGVLRMPFQIPQPGVGLVTGGSVREGTQHMLTFAGQ